MWITSHASSAPVQLAVSLSKDTVLPAHAESQVVGSVECQGGITGLIEPFLMSTTEGFLCIPGSLVSVDDNSCILIVIANMSTEPVTLCQGTVLAEMHQVIVSSDTSHRLNTVVQQAWCKTQNLVWLAMSMSKPVHSFLLSIFQEMMIWR